MNEEDMEKEVLKEKKQAIRDAQEMKALKKTEGWRLLSEHLNSQHNIAASKLLTEKDIDQIYVLQSKIEIINKIFGYVGYVIKRGEAMAKEVK